MEAQTKMQEMQLKLAEIESKKRLLAAEESLALAKIEADKQKLAHEIDASALRLATQRAKVPPAGASTRPPQNASV
jgi:hypothetical protein